MVKEGGKGERGHNVSETQFGGGGELTEKGSAEER